MKQKKLVIFIPVRINKLVNNEYMKHELKLELFV